MLTTWGKTVVSYNGFYKRSINSVFYFIFILVPIVDQVHSLGLYSPNCDQIDSLDLYSPNCDQIDSLDLYSPNCDKIDSLVHIQVKPN